MPWYWVVVGALWEEGAALCWTQTPVPIPSHQSGERWRSWEWRSEHQPWGEQGRGEGKEFPLFLCFLPYLTIFRKVESVLPIMVIVKCLYLNPWVFPSYFLLCPVEEGEREGGWVGGWQLAHVKPTMHYDYTQTSKHWRQPATSFNLGYDMCKHLKNLLSPLILHLMKFLTVTVICKSIKSFLMPKILHFPECQPTADRLAFSIANLSQFYPLLLKANNLEFTAIKSIFRVRRLSLTMNFTYSGNQFFSVWFWGFIWSMMIYSLWDRHRAVNPQVPKANYCWRFPYWYTI